VSSSDPGPLAGERDFVARAKRLALTLLGCASASYGDGLKDEQEILAQIADVVIETYAIESGLVRAEKMSSRGDSRSGVAIDIARVYAGDAADRIKAASSEVVSALTSRDAGLALADDTGRLAAYAATDRIAARRRVADAVIESGKYPF
jgi:hypothetical protein